MRIAPSSPGIDRIEARFNGHAFDPHRHDTYALGITTSGVQCFGYRGAERHSTTGKVIVLHPDETHDGHAGCEAGFCYRMLYVEPHLIAAALGSDSQALPFVSDPVSGDDALARSISAAVCDLDAPLDELERDAVLADLAAALCAASDNTEQSVRIPALLPEMMRVRACIEDSIETGVSSADLEQVSGLDRYATARHFRICFGTSPHRYLVMRRLDRAKTSMLTGLTIADAAADSGFADQSHLTRHFRKAYGMTPGRWLALTRPALPKRLM